MGAPIIQPDYTSKQTFTDGSVAGRASDRDPWFVLCGPDLAHNDPAADCIAADFADRQNQQTDLVFQAAQRDAASAAGNLPAAE